MMNPNGWDSRTRLLIGDEAADRLASASVTVAGLGGVGGYVAEALARSGVGRLTIIDADVVSLSNINRQLIADVHTIGEDKSELWRRRLLSINPELRIIARKVFITEENVPNLLADNPDFVADAIDTVAPKAALMTACVRNGVPFISSMGAGGRMNPAQVRYGTLAATCSDGLARTLRTRLRRLGIPLGSVPVVWSTEMPERRAVIDLDERNKRSSFGTLVTIPALFGLYMANYIIREISRI